MVREKILEEVEKLCREVFDNSSVIIKEETSADEIEEWDSFAHVSLIMALQDFFKIKFALGELQDIQNIGELLSLIESKQDVS